MKFNTKLVLGIESTAHTWSVGIMGFNGEVFSLVNDTFIPDKGGLHPYHEFRCKSSHPSEGDRGDRKTGVPCVQALCK